MTAHILEKFSFETNMKLHTIFPQPFPLPSPPSHPILDAVFKVAKFSVSPD